MFYFHPYLGKWSNLTNMFQMGWNHQLDCKKGHRNCDLFEVFFGWTWIFLPTFARSFFLSGVFLGSGQFSATVDGTRTHHGSLVGCPMTARRWWVPLFGFQWWFGWQKELVSEQLPCFCCVCVAVAKNLLWFLDLKIFLDISPEKLRYLLTFGLWVFGSSSPIQGCITGWPFGIMVRQSIFGVRSMLLMVGSEISKKSTWNVFETLVTHGISTTVRSTGELIPDFERTINRSSLVHINWGRSTFEMRFTPPRN